jgi:hypothetical protein
MPEVPVRYMCEKELKKELKFAKKLLGELRGVMEFYDNGTIKCWECGAHAATEEHHPVPRSRGGKRTVALCAVCHSKAHGWKSSKRLDATKHGSLVLEGMEKKKAAGKSWVSMPLTDEEFLERHKTAAELVKRGYGYKEVIEQTGCASTTVRRLRKILRIPKGTWMRNYKDQNSSAELEVTAAK